MFYVQDIFLYFTSAEEYMITTKIAAILAVGLIGILVNYATAVVSQAHAAGGIMGLVAHGSQDVYLTKQVNKLQSEENKTQSEVNELKAQVNKLQSEEKCTGK
jgi:uncharacterized protein YlxW (UPF0749 family)